MIRYFCDVCGKEINNYFHEFSTEASIQHPFRARNMNATALHFHDECLQDMLDYLRKKELGRILGQEDEG